MSTAIGAATVRLAPGIPRSVAATLGLFLPVPGLAAAVAQGPLPGQLHGRRRRRRGVSRGWILAGAAGAAALILLGLVMFPRMMAAEPPPGPPVAVARVTLESDPDGTAVVMVLQDQTGRDVPLVGELGIELREPDGARWESTRTVTPADFRPVPAGSLLQGRLGYRVVVPPEAWTRPPRRGGQAGIQLQVAPRNGTAFRHQGTDIFP